MHRTLTSLALVGLLVLGCSGGDGGVAGELPEQQAPNLGEPPPSSGQDPSNAGQAPPNYGQSPPLYCVGTTSSAGYEPAKTSNTNQTIPRPSDGLSDMSGPSPAPILVSGADSSSAFAGDAPRARSRRVMSGL